MLVDIRQGPRQRRSRDERGPVRGDGRRRRPGHVLRHRGRVRARLSPPRQGPRRRLEVPAAPVADGADGAPAAPHGHLQHDGGVRRLGAALRPGGEPRPHRRLPRLARPRRRLRARGDAPLLPRERRGPLLGPPSPPPARALSPDPPPPPPLHVADGVHGDGDAPRRVRHVPGADAAAPPLRPAARGRRRRRARLPQLRGPPRSLGGRPPHLAPLAAAAALPRRSPRVFPRQLRADPRPLGSPLRHPPPRGPRLRRRRLRRQGQAPARRPPRRGEPPGRLRSQGGAAVSRGSTDASSDESAADERLDAAS